MMRLGEVVHWQQDEDENWTRTHRCGNDDSYTRALQTKLQTNTMMVYGTSDCDCDFNEKLRLQMRALRLEEAPTEFLGRAAYTNNFSAVAATIIAELYRRMSSSNALLQREKPAITRM